MSERRFVIKIENSPEPRVISFLDGNYGEERHRLNNVMVGASNSFSGTRMSVMRVCTCPSAATYVYIHIYICVCVACSSRSERARRHTCDHARATLSGSLGRPILVSAWPLLPRDSPEKKERERERERDSRESGFSERLSRKRRRFINIVWDRAAEAARPPRCECVYTKE